jgi:transposase InsO family protein
MSAAISPATGRAYGVERVCRLWELPRSSYYAQLGEAPSQPAAGARRGPRPELSDLALERLIREDLASSPFVGEGHRKVWARLKVLREVRVSRKRVLRIMREQHLLSPRRVRCGEGLLHEGTITTDAPNLMWGTDGARVLTVEDGWGWIFVGVEHFSTECVGHHVCKEGTRYEALQPIAMGLTEIYGSVGADVARGLELRMDHGTQYLSDHYLNQVRFWGIKPSFAFVEQPQTNGVAERFIRTLKEQVIHGRVYRTLDEVRQAVAAFVKLYNEQWRVEKLGFLTPREAREQYGRSKAA